MSKVYLIRPNLDTRSARHLAMVIVNSTVQGATLGTAVATAFDSHADAMAELERLRLARPHTLGEYFPATRAEWVAAEVAYALAHGGKLK